VISLFHVVLLGKKTAASKKNR